MGQTILLDILEEHLEEADFLWSQRQAALIDRDSSLSRLADLEERLLAHLDGLLLAGDAGWQFLAPKLYGGSAGEAFAAAWVAVASGQSKYLDAVLTAVTKAKEPVLEGMRQACCLVPDERAPLVLHALLDSGGAGPKAVALDALSFRRVAVSDRQLESLLQSHDPLVETVAAIAAGRLRRKTLVPLVEGLLDAESPSLRQEAIRAGLLAGSVKALAHCRAAVEGKAEDAGCALVLLGLVGQAGDIRLLIEALNHPEFARQAAFALGWLGDPIGIDRLIPLAHDRTLSRLVGDMVRLVTGADLEKEGLVLKAPPSAGTSPSRTETEDDAFVDDPDEGLPWPDAVKLSAWWKAKAAQFEKGKRYRQGRLYGRDVLIDMLRHGALPDRHHAAFELAMLDPTGPLIETRALAAQQQRQCATLRR